MAGNLLLLAIGAVLGVLAACFVYLVCRLWALTLHALFRRWWYRGVNIAGDWKGLGTAPTPAAGEWSEVVLRLRQDTVHLAGFMAIRNRCAGGSFDLRLRVVGRITHGHATLVLSAADEGDTSVATALLEIERGAALNGQLVYRNPLTQAIDVIDVSVHHAESAAMPRLQPAGRPAPVLPLLQAGAAQ